MHVEYANKLLFNRNLFHMNVKVKNNPKVKEHDTQRTSNLHAVFSVDSLLLNYKIHAFL